MNDNFWEGGDIEYARVLFEEFEQTRDKLKSELQACTDKHQIAKLRRSLEDAKTDYERKLREITQSLF